MPARPGPQVGPAARPGQPVRPAVQGHAGAGRALPHRGLAAGRCHGPRGHPGPGTEPAGCSEHRAQHPAPHRLHAGSAGSAGSTGSTPRSAPAPHRCAQPVFPAQHLKANPSLPRPPRGHAAMGPQQGVGQGEAVGLGASLGGSCTAGCSTPSWTPTCHYPRGQNHRITDCRPGLGGGTPRTPRIGTWGPRCLPAPKPPHIPL